MKNYLKLFSATSIWAFFNGYLMGSLDYDRERKRDVPQATGTAFGMVTGAIGALLSLCEFACKKKNPFAGLTAKQLMALAGLGLVTGASNVFFYTALTMGQLPNVTLVHSLAFPIAAVFVAFFLKEKFHTTHVLAVIAGFAGVVTIAIKEGHVNFSAWFLFALFSSFGYGGEITFSTLLGRLNVDGKISTLTKLLFQIPIMYIGSKMLHHPLSFGNPAAILKALIGGILLYSSFKLVFSSLGHKEEGKVPGRDFSIIGYAERFGMIAIGILWFRNSLERHIIIGGLCILLAEALVIFGRERRQDKT